MALVTLVDKNRQWFKSHSGLPADLAEARSTSRDISLCGHVIAKDEVLIVRDLARDPASQTTVCEREWTSVLRRRPYGVRMVFRLGRCVLDMKPREMTRQEQDP